MDFESALRAELASITELTNKVFPLAGLEGTETPFVIYAKSNTDFIKTMDGTSTTRHGRYELNLISNTYANLQSLLVSVKNKLISFEKRVIGTSGPFIQSVVIENINELYEEQVKFYRAYFEIRFYYEGS